MNSFALCTLLLTFCLILISQFLLATNVRAHDHHSLLGDGPDLIGHICKQTKPEDMNNCTNILRGDSKILHAKNFFEISKAILELALSKGIEGQNFLKELAKTKSSPAIAQCSKFPYTEVVGSFRSALAELKADPLIANYDAKVASDGPAMCDTLLEAAHIVNPAISTLNHQISLLSYIAFLATNELMI